MFLADGHYRAAVREPGGTFGSLADLGTTAPSGTPEPSYLPAHYEDTAAVSADGTAAALITTTTELSCYIPPPQGSPPSDHGFAYGLQTYRLDPGTTGWTHAGSIGGAGGNSTSYPALAGGPGGRIDAAWAVDKRSEGDRCQYTNEPPFVVVAGQLFPTAAPAEVFSDTPPSTGNTQGTIYNAGPHTKLAVNSCGDGVLIFGVSLGVPEDGMYLSTTTSGACTSGTTPGGTGQPPGDGGQPGGGNPMATRLATRSPGQTRARSTFHYPRRDSDSGWLGGGAYVQTPPRRPGPEVTRRRRASRSSSPPVRKRCRR